MAASGATGAQPHRASRAAIIFIPGMADTWVNQSVETVGGKLASALDNQATNRAATFDVEVWQTRYGPKGHLVSPGCTIRRKDNGIETAAIDVYRLDSVRELRGDWDNRSPLVKTLLPLYMLWSYLHVALRPGKREGKSFRERFQFFYAISIGLILTAYLALMVYSIVALAIPSLASSYAARIPAGATLLLTVLGLTRATVVNRITSSATGYICVLRYLRFGAGRDNLVGNLARLIQHLHERETVEYDRIDIVAYSFGTIVALDGLFPPSGRGIDSFNAVGQLVTIGCPFDFIRSYWPQYFATRERRENEFPWLNVYLPIDILSSNFNNDPSADKAAIGIPTSDEHGFKPANLLYAEPSAATKLGIVDFLVLMGLQSHDFYWGTGDASDLGVFPHVVRTLYNNHAALA